MQKFKQCKFQNVEYAIKKLYIVLVERRLYYERKTKRITRTCIKAN